MANAGFASIFVRAIRNASPEKQFFGQDGGDGGAVSHGGAGIYLSVTETAGQLALRINVKSYVVGDSSPYKSNIYMVAIDSRDITVVDYGSMIYIMAGDKLVATIALSGTADYGIDGVSATDSAATAIITLRDGTVYEIDNVVAAATCDTANSVGVATRGGGVITFSAISVMPANTVEVPGFTTDEIVTPVILPAYHANIDHINGAGANGAANYSALGASVVNSDGTVPVVDAVADGKTTDENGIITLNGWMAVNGGINRYVYSLDGGETWLDAVGGRDGEPLENYYANLGMTQEGSLKNGLFNGAGKLVIDLSAYSGQTVNLLVGVVPENVQEAVIPFISIVNLSVVGPVEEPELSIKVTTTDTYCYVDNYSFTAEVSGTYTFTVPAGLGLFSQSAQSELWGSPEIDFQLESEGGSVSVDLAAGQTYEFSVGAATKADWVITYTFVEGEVNNGDDSGDDDGDETPVGDISGTYTATTGFGSSGVVVIDAAAGTLVFTSNGNVNEYTYTIDGSTVTLANQNGPISEGMAMFFGGLELENGVPAYFYYNGYTYVLSVAGDEPETPDEDPDEPSDVPALVLGSNTITVTEADLEEGAIEYTFVVTEADQYSFSSNDLAAVIYFANGDQQRGSAYLEPGEYTIMVVIYAWSAGDYTMTVTGTTSAGGDDGNEGGNAGEGDGSIDNPYVIGSLPYEITVDGSHDVYYSYTVTEDCTIIITYPAGNYVSGLVSFDKDAANRVYTVYASAGETITINPWGSNAGTYTITVA